MLDKLVYSYNDYKVYLRELLNSQDANWGAVSRMADAAGCQRSYLSRCLNAETHLTPDHAYNISQFLKMNETEEDYFLCLVEKERAASASYRNRIETKLKKIRSEQEDLSKIAKRPKIEMGQQEVTYYSNWLYTALHILVSIPEFQTVKTMASRLQVDAQLIELHLEQLESMGLVKKDSKKWIFNSSELHVPKNSPLVNLHHNNWRQRALLDSQKMPAQSVHYTVIQSLNQKAFDEIRNRILKVIAEITDIAAPSPSEELVCFTCDYFKV